MPSSWLTVALLIAHLALGIGALRVASSKGVYSGAQLLAQFVLVLFVPLVGAVTVLLIARERDISAPAYDASRFEPDERFTPGD